MAGVPDEMSKPSTRIYSANQLDLRSSGDGIPQFSPCFHIAGTRLLQHTIQISLEAARILQDFLVNPREPVKEYRSNTVLPGVFQSLASDYPWVVIENGSCFEVTNQRSEPSARTMRRLLTFTRCFRETSSHC